MMTTSADDRSSRDGCQQYLVDVRAEAYPKHGQGTESEHCSQQLGAGIQETASKPPEMGCACASRVLPRGET